MLLSWARPLSTTHPPLAATLRDIVRRLAQVAAQLGELVGEAPPFSTGEATNLDHRTPPAGETRTQTSAPADTKRQHHAGDRGGGAGQCEALARIVCDLERAHSA